MKLICGFLGSLQNMMHQIFLVKYNKIGSELSYGMQQLLDAAETKQFFVTWSLRFFFF